MVATLQLIASLLKLAAVFSALPIQSISAPPIRPVSSVFPYTISPTVSGISFPAPTGSNFIAYSTDLATQTLGPTARTNSPTQPSMASATAANATTGTPDQSSWNSGVISTVVFGCIASILAVLAIWATIWLGRRQTSSAARNNIESSQARGPYFILEGLQIGIPPSHHNSTSVPEPADPPHQPWGIVPQDIHAPACGTSIVEAPPPAYVSPSVRI